MELRVVKALQVLLQRFLVVASGEKRVALVLELGELLEQRLGERGGQRGVLLVRAVLCGMWERGGR